MTKTQYLIDIGFDVNVYLRISAKATLSSNTLFAANRSIIQAYGDLILRPNYWGYAVPFLGVL